MNVDTFLEQFGRLADAPEGIKKLRELILDLAVHGKLVEQDQSDEPAKDLLEFIVAEKQQLSESGEIPKQFSKTTSFDEYSNIELKNGWTFTQLGSISHKIHYGYTAKANSLIKKVRLLRITDIQNDRVDWNSVPGCEISDSKLKSCQLQNDDILIARTGGTIGKSYLVSDISVCSVFASYLIRIIPSKFVYAPYIKVFANSSVYWHQLYSASAGTGQPNVNAKSLSTLILPLPPLAEQKRIVAKVDELMALCDELETQQQQRQTVHAQLTTASLHQLTTAETPRQLTKAWQRIDTQFDQLFTTRESIEKLRQTILQLAVQGKLVPQNPEDEPAEEVLNEIEAAGTVKTNTDLINENEIPFKIPTSWEWSRASILFDVTGGITKNSKRVPKQNHFPYLRVANVQRDLLELDQIERFELFDGELERWKLVPNDLLIVEGNGSEKEIGRCAIWNGEIKNCVHQNHLIRCRPRRNVEPKFSLIYFNSPSGMNVMKDKAITTSGLYSLSVGKVRSLVVPLPPRKEQKRIVTKVNQLMTLCDHLEQSLEAQDTNADNLSNSMTSAVLNAD